MQPLQDDYNTSRSPLKLGEYGRHIQEYVNFIQTLASKEERTKLASGLVQIMAHLNPTVKEQADFKQKLWDQLHFLANFQLDVDCPYPIPSAEERQKKPETLGYNDTVIKFRFYGRNLQNMVAKVSEMEEGELKQDMINLIASFMYNSCKSWNNENLSNEVISEHLKILSKGKLVIGADEFTVSPDTHQFQRRNFNQPSKNQGYGNNNNRRNNNRNNRNKGKFRRY